MSATSQSKEMFNDYDGFVEKFKPKKTTDDCYTPPIIYEAIAGWVAKTYSLNNADFVRPFFPGGDYETFDYSGKIVVDNPPFSILAKIIKFYTEREIRFFLFAPTLTSVRYGDECTVLAVGAQIIYENGANLNTSFVTNLEPHEIRVRSEPNLYSVIFEAISRNEKQKRAEKSLPKYRYPQEVVTMSDLYQFARHGIRFDVPRSESRRISQLAAQKAAKKTIFGCGLLLSDRSTSQRKEADLTQIERMEERRKEVERKEAERKKAEREKAICWELSDKEREMIAVLNS